MTHEIKEIMQRPYRYFYEDGIAEIAVGGLFLALGLSLQAVEAAQSISALVIVVAIGLPLLAICGGILLKKVVGGLKEHVTYPRTGYVSYKSKEPSRGRWLISGAALVFTVVLMFIPERFSQISIAEGGMLFIILSYMGYRIGMKRFYLIGAIAALIGLAAAFLTTGDIPGSTATFGGTGIVMIISGVIVLSLYLRKNRRPDENLR